MPLEYPEDLKYLDSHEYVRVEGETAIVGISAFAVDQLGDIVFVELPDPDATLTKGDKFGTVESVKAVEDMYSPVSGTVVECNAAAVESPEAIAEDPYGAGWLLKVRIANAEELADTLSASEYRSKVEGE